MPGRTASGKRRQNGNFVVKEEDGRKNKEKQPAHEEDEEGEDQDAEGENEEEYQEIDDEGAGSSKGAKRRRVNGEGGSESTSSNHETMTRIVMKTLPRDVDGYIPGSIVRIRLHNFLTYDFVEFRPGPYLNMIIGPNGTGKSSVACAIAIGLNWSPHILGRATDLNAFVKNDKDKGYTEIELKGPKGQKNLTIRRHLSATSKTSTFTLNGQPATGNEIKSKMAALNVQVGNLCSFLPQDKVSEFAAMSPQKLLEETQLAAGDPNLTMWHANLISSGKELKQLQISTREEEEMLKQLVERNEGIERDVQRYLERKKLERTIALLNVLIPVEKYRDIRIRFMDAKARQRSLHAKVSALKEKNAPAHALLKKLEQSHKECERRREDMKKSTQGKFKKMQNKWATSDQLETDADDVAGKLEELKKEEKDRQGKIKRLKADIANLEAELEKAPVKLEKMEDLTDEARQLGLERSEVVARKEEVDGQLKANIEKRAQANIQLDHAQRGLQKLDDADVRKLRMMGKWDNDTHDAIKWLRAHKHLFRKEVFEPPFMSVTIKDKRYTNAVESCFSASQMKSFVAQCQEDCDTLNNNINDSGALGRNARITTYFRNVANDSLIPPPITREELQENNLDGYALDYIEYPPGMERFLMNEVNLHRTVIALNPNNVDVNRVMQLVARPIPNRHPGGAVFINGTTMNNVSRSRYGRKAVGNVTRDVPQARNFVVPTIDLEEKHRFDEMIQTAKQDLLLYDEERRELDQKLKNILDEDKVFEKKMDDIRRRKDAIREAEKRRVTAQSRLTRNKNQLQTLLNAPSVEEETIRLKKKLIDISDKRVVIAKEYIQLARAVITEQTEATRVGLEYLQVGANRAALQELCNRKDEKYQTALAEFNRVDNEFQEIKNRSKQILEDSRKAIAEAPEDLQAEYKEIETARIIYEREVADAEKDGRPKPDAEGVDLRTLDELEEELETQKTNLDMNLNTNPGVVEQYEKRKRDIEQHEKTLQGKKAKAEKLERDIKNARDNWQPALEKLVASIGEKFSAAFDRIGCAGEIRISEHEDYEKWAIDILVKFRDKEKLQLLTGQRQSGGERSLTTILYLMSLTEEARAPFSLVDEINQGMDQRAERMVHNSMVEVTCKPESAQYFLITPKLLPDLKYHERMKILCVNNGEWLPEEGDLGNMMNMIDTFLQHKRPANEH